MQVSNTFPTSQYHALIILAIEPSNGDVLPMAIYNRGRVANELHELEHATKTPSKFYTITSMHYLGSEPLECIVKIFKFTGEKRHTVLDFGAGYAGDAV